MNEFDPKNTMDNFDKEFSMNKKKDQQGGGKFPAWLWILLGAAVIAAVVIVRGPAMRSANNGPTRSAVSIPAGSTLVVDNASVITGNDEKAGSSELEARIRARGNGANDALFLSDSGQAYNMTFEVLPTETVRGGENTSDAPIYWVDDQPFALHLKPAEEENAEPGASDENPAVQIGDQSYNLSLEPIDEAAIDALPADEQTNIIHVDGKAYRLEVESASESKAAAPAVTDNGSAAAVVPAQSENGPENVEVPAAAEAPVSGPDGDTAVIPAEAPAAAESEAPVIARVNDKVYAVTVKPHVPEEKPENTAGNEETVTEQPAAPAAADVEKPDDSQSAAVAADVVTDQTVEIEPAAVPENSEAAAVDADKDQALVSETAVVPQASDASAADTGMDQAVEIEPPALPVSNADNATDNAADEPGGSSLNTGEPGSTAVPSEAPDAASAAPVQTSDGAAGSDADNSGTAADEKPADSSSAVHSEGEPGAGTSPVDPVETPDAPDMTTEMNDASAVEAPGTAETFGNAEPVSAAETAHDAETAPAGKQEEKDPRVVLFDMDGVTYEINLVEVDPEDVTEASNDETIVWVNDMPMALSLVSETSAVQSASTDAAEDGDAFEIVLSALPDEQTARLREDKFGKSISVDEVPSEPETVEETPAEPDAQADPEAEPQPEAVEEPAPVEETPRSGNWFVDVFRNIFGEDPTPEPTPQVTVIPITPTPTVPRPTKTPIVLSVAAAAEPAGPVRLDATAPADTQKAGDLEDPALYDNSGDPEEPADAAPEAETEASTEAASSEVTEASSDTETETETGIDAETETETGADAETDGTPQDESGETGIDPALEIPEEEGTETDGDEPGEAQPSATQVPEELPHTGAADSWNIPSLLTLFAGLLLVIIGVRRMRGTRG